MTAYPISHQISDVAAVVVLYNFGYKVVENIKTYVDEVGTIYLVDNSDVNVDAALVEELVGIKTAKYLSNSGNRGIGNALNVGARAATADGYKYLLTMDQDTKLAKHTVSREYKKMREIGMEDVAIVSPEHFPRHGNKNDNFVIFTMTSANLLALKAYSKVGQFREDFFIDQVDHEFCLRLNSHGFRILELSEIPIDHELGELRKIDFLLFEYTYRIHSPNRFYYMVRNGLVTKKMFGNKFPTFTAYFWKMLRNELIKALAFGPKRSEYIRNLMHAVNDYRLGRMGQRKL